MGTLNVDSSSLRDAAVKLTTTAGDIETIDIDITDCGSSEVASQASLSGRYAAAMLFDLADVVTEGGNNLYGLAYTFEFMDQSLRILGSSLDDVAGD